MAKSAGESRRAALKKIREAILVLKAIGMPPKQANERSALTLLSLLDLQPRSLWIDVGNALMGITPMMDYFAAHYRKKYAPNSREMVRRYTIHQFEQAGIVIRNPDKPRAINSPDNVYQIDSSTLELLRTFGTDDWDRNLSAYFQTRESLKARYAAERTMRNIPLVLQDGKTIQLSPGGHNILIKHVIEEFCPYCGRVA